MTRRGAEDIAILSAAELQSLIEMAYLMRSPRNARRLLDALQQSLKGEGQSESVDSLGLGKEA